MTAKTLTLPVDPELAYDALRYLTVARVVNYLMYSFDAAYEEILDRENGCRRWATTPADLVATVNAGKLACDTPIVFWGGPPNDGEWYAGSLLAMLIDRLFFSMACGNIDKVDRFLASLQ